jgi:hypothetical protein
MILSGPTGIVAYRKILLAIEVGAFDTLVALAAVGGAGGDGGNGANGQDGGKGGRGGSGSECESGGMGGSGGAGGPGGWGGIGGNGGNGGIIQLFGRDWLNPDGTPIIDLSGGAGGRDGKIGRPGQGGPAGDIGPSPGHYEASSDCETRHGAVGPPGPPPPPPFDRPIDHVAGTSGQRGNAQRIPIKDG